PGVPTEMKTLFREQVDPWIREHYKISHFMESRLLKIAGLPESEVAKQLEPVLKADDIHSGIFAGEGVITIKLTALGDNQAEIRKKLLEQETQVRQLFGKAVFGDGNQSLPQVILEHLSQHQQTLATAESCTGGMLGAEITSVPGASKSYLQGLITYSNPAKMEQLGVQLHTLEKCGAVSEETAREMAEGLRKKAKTTYTVSVTGIAGPDGGTLEKPVGMVCFGVSGPKGTTSYTRHFYGTRDSIRKRATTAALLLLYLKMIEDHSKS
ncbi:MAG: nicotinamide-nucleotide amidohydrolase family protein, partial [Planctomycetota bacterium]